MAESRQELVNWVNDLLLTNITRVEQCGTGAIFCQIFDSIFLDVPMAKVRFDYINEYQFLNNFKVLQSAFTKHGIDRSVPVERLVKCRFQDNLEFLQWTRKYWEANFPGHEYDPLSRRKGNVPISAVNGGSNSSNGSRPGSRTVSSGSAAGGRASVTKPSTQASRPPPAGGGAGRPRPSMAGGGNGAPRRQPGTTANSSANGAGSMNAAKERVAQLESENSELISAVDLVESERDFYFQKLRDIEVLIQTASDQLAEGNGDIESDMENLDVNESNNKENSSHAHLVREIQTVLYSTTEGFEIPTQEYETEETF